MPPYIVFFIAADVMPADIAAALPFTRLPLRRRCCADYFMLRAPLPIALFASYC